MKAIEFIDISAFDKKHKELHKRFFSLSEAQNFIMEQIGLPHIEKILIKKRGKRSPK